MGEIGEADLNFGLWNANGAHKKAHWTLLAGEDVLDGAEDFQPLRAGNADAVGHRSALRLLAVDA